MSKIFKIGIVVVVVYFGIKQVPPLVDKISEMGEGLSRKGDSVSQGQCVPAAERASEAFAVEMRNYPRPPFDLDAWEYSLERVREHTYEAESRCACGLDSCVRATEALNELDALISEFDDSLRGEGMPLNPARRQETINRLLKRAREFDRQGN